MEQSPRSKFAEGLPSGQTRSVGTAQCAANSQPYPPEGAQPPLGTARREA